MTQARPAVLLLVLFTFLLPAAHGADDNPRVLIETTKGDIIIELYPEDAPISVDNFLSYVDSGFYDGLIFHRVIQDFVIQAGGFDPNFTKPAPNDPITLEKTSVTGLSNERGTVAMARQSDPNSATSQFFINHVDNPELDYQDEDEPGYAVFGTVAEGLNVVDIIAAVETGFRNNMTDVPVDDVIIERAMRELADLVVNEPSDPNVLTIRVEPDDVVTIEIEIENEGVRKAISTQASHPPITTTLSQASYEPFSPDDPNIIELGSFTITSLEIDTTYSQTITFNAPTESGFYYIRAETDSQDVITEGRETNNLGRIYDLIVEPNSPDLVMEDPGLDPLHAEPNDIIEIDFTVRNLGASRAYYIADPNNPNDDDDTIVISVYVDSDPNNPNAQAVTEFEIEGLDGGDTETEEISFNAPLDRGDYYVWAVADDPNRVAEYSEDNNRSVLIPLNVEIPANIEFERFNVSAGRVAHTDSFYITGTFDAEPADFETADDIRIRVGPYSTTLAKHHFRKSGDNIYIYRAFAGIQACMLDLQHGKFAIRGKFLDLTGFEAPVMVEIEMGSYYSWASATESVVNGSKATPLAFLQGVKDTLTVDRFLFVTDRPQSNSRDRLYLWGQIAMEQDDADLEDKEVTIKWGSKTFKIPEDSLQKKWGRNVFVFNRKPWHSTKIVKATLDLERNTFNVMIRKGSSLGMPAQDFRMQFDVTDDIEFDQTVEDVGD